MIAGSRTSATNSAAVIVQSRMPMSAAQSSTTTRTAATAASAITAPAVQAMKTSKRDFNVESRRWPNACATHGSGRPAEPERGDNRGMTDPDPPPAAQPRNPLHGMTLEAIVTALVDAYGWQGLDERIPLRCFAFEPSIKSSLKLLRKTPWAREKVESLYLFMLRDMKREERWRG